jgi:hypothetical protein
MNPKLSSQIKGFNPRMRIIIKNVREKIRTDLTVDVIMQAAQIAPQLMPLLVLGTGIYSAKTGDVPVVFEPFTHGDMTTTESTDLVRDAHEEGETEESKDRNKRQAICLGCWMLTLTITAVAAIT